MSCGLEEKRDRKSGSTGSELQSKSRAIVSLLRYFYSKHRGRWLDNTINVFLCVFMFRREHTLSSIEVATSSSTAQREEGDKRTVISVKANKIRPNLLMLPYGQKPDMTEARGGGKRLSGVHVWFL